MRKNLLKAAGTGLLALGFAQAIIFAADLGRNIAAADPADLLKGCMDVPEAVELADTLKQRGLRIERYSQELDRKKAEIEVARAELTKTLTALRAVKGRSRDQSFVSSNQVSTDTSRMIAVYDQMKPEQAATVLSNLPPQFAADILMRVTPENSARIMAAVDPGQAALLTSYMGARSAAKLRD